MPNERETATAAGNRAPYDIRQRAILLDEIEVSGVEVLQLESEVANDGYRLQENFRQHHCRPEVQVNAAVLGATADALAIAFVLEQPWADVVLIGPATVSQLLSNLRALDLRLDKASRTALEALRESPEDYWRRRAALPWQ